MIGKILEYDRNPVPADWYDGVSLSAIFQDTKIVNCHDDAWAFETVAHIRMFMEDHSAFNIHEVYCKQWVDPPLGPCQIWKFRIGDYNHRPDMFRGYHVPLSRFGLEDDISTPCADCPDAITNALNQGNGLALYIGHGSVDQWIAPHLDVSDIRNNLTSTSTPLVFSMSCNTGRFEQECIAEEFILKNNGGAIGVIAPSDLSSVGPTELMARGLITCFYPEYDPDYIQKTVGNSFRFGDALLFTEFYLGFYYDIHTTQRHCEIFHCLGDPEMMLRTDTPHPLQETSLPDSISAGSSEIYISSEEEGALIAISQNSILKGRGIVENGTAVVRLWEPLEAGVKADIVVTGHNLDPVETTCAVTQGTLGSISLDKIKYDCNEEFTVTVQDADMNFNFSSVQELTVDLSSDAQPATAYILTETGPDTGIFTGRFELVSGSPGHNQLQVNSTDTIRAVYHDTTCDPETDLAAEASYMCKPYISFGGYGDSFIKLYDGMTCGVVTALAYVPPTSDSVGIERVGLTPEPVDSHQPPDIQLPFINTGNNIWSISTFFTPEFEIPADNYLCGIGAYDDEGSYSNHWPFLEVEPDPDNPPEGGGSGEIEWIENMQQVQGAQITQPIQGMVNSFAGTLMDMGKGNGPGDNPIIWAGGYLDTQLKVGVESTFQLLVLVSPDQYGSEIDKIYICKANGDYYRDPNSNPIFLTGFNTCDDCGDFVYFYNEWITTPSGFADPKVYCLKAVDIEGDESDLWPYIKVHESSSSDFPYITSTSTDRTTCQVNWFQADSITIDNFVVHWRDTVTGEEGVSATLENTMDSFTIGNLSECHEYEIYVTATDICGNQFNSDPVTDLASYIDVPYNLHIERESGSWIVRWDRDVPGVNYAMYWGYDLNPENYTLVGTYSEPEAPQPRVQGITKYVAVRCYTKLDDPNQLGCFSEPIRCLADLPSQPYPIKTTIIDMNLDSIMDLVMLTQDFTLIIYLGQEDNTWLDAGQAFPSNLKDFTLFDFNKDGYPDLALAESTEVRTYFNDGSAVMNETDSLFPPGDNNVIKSDDLDQKGTSDVVVGSSEGTLVKILDENGDTQELQFLESGDTKTMVTADLDGDGKQEIITSTDTGENVIWSKDEDGLFSDTAENVFTWGTESIMAQDVNEDGCIDLVITDDSGQEVVFINDCTGHFTLQ